MIKLLTRCLTLLLCAIFLVANPGFAEQNEEAYRQWEKDNAAAARAFDEARYSEALSLYQTALVHAEKITYGGPRAITYYGMAKTYHKDRKTSEAETYYKRALDIFDSSARRRTSYLASCIKDYASLLRELGRGSEAAELEGRLKPAQQQN
jgi:tetratricopeptide (TPR) repeat protein